MISSMTKWSQCCWSVPDDPDALETEMVGVPELCVWWLAALLSDAASLEYKLATLSAPSGCIQTQKDTLLNHSKLFKQNFFASVLPVGACAADPDPPGVAAGGQSVRRCWSHIVDDRGHPRGLQQPWTVSATQEDEQKYLKIKMLENGESVPEGHQNNTKNNYSCLKSSEHLERTLKKQTDRDWQQGDRNRSFSAIWSTCPKTHVVLSNL